MNKNELRHSVHISLRKDDPFEHKLGQAMKMLPHGWGKIVFVKLTRSILSNGSVEEMRSQLEMLCSGPVNFQPAETLVLPAKGDRPAIAERIESAKAPVEHVSRETSHRSPAPDGAMAGLFSA